MTAPPENKPNPEAPAPPETPTSSDHSDPLAQSVGDIKSRLARLSEREAELRRREAEMENGRESVDKLYRQAAGARGETRLQEHQIAKLRGWLAAREARLRDESRQLEADCESLRRECAAFTTEQTQPDPPFSEAEPEPDRPSAPQPSLEPPAAPPPVNLSRRALLLSALAGLLAGSIWYTTQMPRFRGLAELQVTGQRGSPERIAWEHVDGLMSDALLEHWQEPPTAESWIAARAAPNVAVRRLPENGMLQLSFDTPDQALAQELPPAVIRAYIAYLNTLPLDHFRSPRHIEWTAQHDALSEELSSRRTRQQEIQARGADTPLPAERGEVQATFDQAVTDFKQTVERLREQREELAALQSREVPRGELSPETYQQALAEDALYQEDLKEFASEARQYRTELAVAMVLLNDPLQDLRKTVRELNATMTEQRDLRPPPNVRTLLEYCLAQMNDLERVLAEFAQGWVQQRETIERLDVPEQVVELVNHQSQATDTCARLLAEVQRVLPDVQSRIDTLSEKDNAGTRAIVVLSVLRGDLTRLAEQADTLAQAADAVNPAANFRIDAHDRQLRGLRTRLRNRQETLQKNLQDEADRLARAAYDEQERQLRETIDASEQQRQTQMETLVNSLQRLQDLDQQHQQLRELNAELNAEQAAVTRLEQRLAQLDAERPQSPRDSIQLVDSRWFQTTGRNRLRNAGFVAAATFAGFELMFLLLLVQRRAAPPARPTAEDQPPPSEPHESA